MIYEIEDGILYSALGNDEHVEIPDGVEYITRDTFRNGKMKSIRFPESLQRISHYAFCNCAELESVRIPDGVERIDAFAFAGCEKLREVILPKALNRIRANCFYQDNALERINIPESVRRIGPKAFDCCTSLREVILPEGLEEIMDDAFRESGLRSVEIPASTRFIGTAVFNDCSDLETLILHDGLEEIGDYAFSNCALKRVELPGTLKKLGKSAFKFCHNLERFCAPDGVFTIRNGILQKYTGTAKHVVVSDGVTGIGKRLFNSCSSLTSVSIRNGLSHIDDRMFSKCSSLTSITLPDGISCIEKGAFGDTACYKNAANWSDGVFYIGEYLIEANADIPSEGYTIRLGTKYIADAAFFGRFLLTDVMIPDSVTSIGEGAFANCILLSELLNANPDCNAGQKLFGERYSGEIAALAKLYHRALTDGDLKKYILNRESWAKLDAATQADIFLAHPGEKLLIAYMDCVSDGEKMDETILNRLSDDASAKDCNTVASFMSLFVQLISSELLQRMYERLKTIRAASKAVKTIGADAVLMKKLKTTAHTGTSQTAVERKMVDIMNRGKLSGNAPGIKLREYYGLSPKDIPELKCRDGQFAPPMIMAYLLTIHEGYNSSDGDRKLTVEYKSPGACPEAADIVAELEYESLQDCLKKLVKENLGPKVRSKKMLLLYPICRYAGESLMEQLTKKTPSWTTPPRRCFEEAYIYSKHPCGHDLR